MFPIDETLHGVNREPAVRTVVHLHGHKVLSESDGYPEAWFTNGFAQTGPFFEQRTYHYPNDQAATQLWYHDHALGATRLTTTTPGSRGSTCFATASRAASIFPTGRSRSR